ncbi:hypothetical protein GWK47_012306 [Chionoecetes opilio]|uniref:Uncharacterized protein n=1 Tax=Chionoecetes opilio TaxID=41210 RepID=A0A8J5CLY6_CHIOP|nr:hypothetical protein GWK47_012306 [Chionoecetes opilio]
MSLYWTLVQEGDEESEPLPGRRGEPARDPGIMRGGVAGRGRRQGRPEVRGWPSFMAGPLHIQAVARPVRVEAGRGGALESCRRVEVAAAACATLFTPRPRLYGGAGHGWRRGGAQHGGLRGGAGHCGAGRCWAGGHGHHHPRAGLLQASRWCRSGRPAHRVGAGRGGAGQNVRPPRRSIPVWRQSGGGAAGVTC